MGKPRTLRSAFQGALKTYGLLWLANFLFSLSAMVISSGLFLVPWYAVVNVTLSLVLFTASIAVAFYVVLAAFNLATGRFAGALTALLTAIMYALLPFASVVGYTAYGWLSGVTSGGEAFVYNDYMFAVRAVLNGAMAILPFTLATPEQWLVRLSGLIALIALIMTANQARRKPQGLDS